MKLGIQCFQKRFNPQHTHRTFLHSQSTITKSTMSSSNNIPFSSACERNKEPILQTLTLIFSQYLQTPPKVFEIGTGTAQHAVHFAASFPDLTWQTSDLLDNHEGIKNQLNNHENLNNILPPIVLDVDRDDNWETVLKMVQENPFDIVYTANTMHIMSWEQTCKMIREVPRLLKADHGLFVVYGPFKKGEKTTPGNASFDENLQLQSGGIMGVRELQDVENQAKNVGFELVEDYAMPANNDLLVFKLR
eukprot:TRINITY_DN2407_c0_g1_i12.p2 TRINITY_DN2407_c0_g1~~TRINITY_DN2407_c0_g1_i12.p2  ORF type:complete len:248 (-),score=14.09 TRINITY_DN2407_c0_g1_i12:189-932(-)